MTKQVVNHSETVNHSSQRVWLEGVINARELGGYMNRDGKKIKGGKILRSGHINNMKTSLLIIRLKSHISLHIQHHSLKSMVLFYCINILIKAILYIKRMEGF